MALLKSKRKDKVKKEENLVFYNLERIKTMVKKLEKDKGDDLWGNYSSILSALDFVKLKVEQDYNIKAHFNCAYCPEEFSGWKAHTRMIRHECKKHPKETAIFQTIITGVLVGVVTKALGTLKPGKTRGVDVPKG